MVNIPRRSGGSKHIRGDSSLPPKPPIQPEYRGQRISEAKVPPIYLSSFQELFLERSNVIDRGVREYYSSRSNTVIEENIALKDKKGEEHIVDRVSIYGQMRNVRLDLILSQVKKNEKTILEDIGIAKYLPKEGVGIVPFGREEDDDYPLVKEDFKNDFEASFSEVQQVIGNDQPEYRKFLDTIDLSKPDDMRIFMNWYYQYLDTSLAQSIPTIESILKQPTKQIRSCFFGDGGITRIRFEETWKTQGFLYLPGTTLCLADPFSSYGSSVRYKRKQKSEVMKALERELEWDKNESCLKRNVGTGRLENFVTQQGDDVLVSMLREEKDPSLNSPITHAPLFDVISPANDTVIVSMGTIDPYVDRQSNSFILSKKQL